ncbi:MULTISPECIES: DUF533 domain-containing protein [Methylobacterium]|jgi:uncharacterized membrane protein YebE (DUF533 family)|uniref:DUF533 domain-containing protein n=1 Tax=Methylobacterium TaxID=407 RepID=UPI0005C1A255|nr:MULTISPECIES: DUF533 domain-containing protein [Methylobacterium]AWV16489.1 hypothetical protein A3862_14085 [Methylobacterium sp. XJLW]KOX43827.1 hypothetical protein ADL19_26855 [Streptomyces purpurogeneiscleroticus]
MADSRRIVDALVRSRGGGLAAGAALGGLALIGSLAYRALRGAPPPESGGPDFTEIDEDEARLMLRAMVAATTADGMVDAAERKRLDTAVADAGLDPDGRSWLDRELADPADVDEIAERVASPDAAARIFAAARLAIDPDTLQERQFLKMLAEALDLPADAIDRVERNIAA